MSQVTGTAEVGDDIEVTYDDTDPITHKHRVFVIAKKDIPKGSDWVEVGKLARSKGHEKK